MQSKTLGTLALAALVVAAGCGGSKGGGSSARNARGSVSITIQWPQTEGRVIPDATNSIRLTLTNSTPGSDLSRTQVVAKPVGNTTSKLTFPDVPTGSGYVVSAQALPSSDGSGTPLATGSATVPTVVADAESTFKIVMATAIQKFYIGVDGVPYVYTFNADGTTGTLTGATLSSGRVPVAGLQTLTVATRNADNVLVLGDTGTGTVPTAVTSSDATKVTATFDSRDKTTATVSYKVLATATSTTASLHVVYHVGTEDGPGAGTTSIDRTFDIPVSTTATANLAYAGSMFPAGKLIRGQTYSPNLTGAFTYSSASTDITLNATTGVFTVKPTVAASASDVAVTITAHPALAGADTSQDKSVTMQIGANRFAFQQTVLPPFNFGSAIYTLAESTGNSLYTAALTNTSAVNVDVENHGRNYTPTLAYYSGPNGTGTILASFTGGTGTTALFGSSGSNTLTVTPVATDNKATALASATVGNVDLGGFTFVSGKTYEIVPKLTVTGATGDQVVPFTLLTRDFGAQTSLFTVNGNGTITIGTTATTQTTTITLEYRKNNAVAATGALIKTYNVTIKPASGGINVGIQ